MGMRKRTDLPLLCRWSNFQSNVERSPGLLCDWSKNSPPKLKPITTWLPAFSRTLGSLVDFTSSSHWLFKVFSSLPIGCCDNFSVSRYSIERYSISHDVSGSRVQVSAEQMTQFSREPALNVHLTSCNQHNLQRSCHSLLFQFYFRQVI